MSLDPSRANPLKTVEGYQLQAAGHEWDAVRVPTSMGLPALAALGERSGAVIEDPREPVLYWFVHRGTASDWNVPETRPLGLDQYLVVPEPHRVRGPGPHWRIRPGDRPLCTDAASLRTVLGHVPDTPGDAPR
jgi:hypothetical protein